LLRNNLQVAQQSTEVRSATFFRFLRSIKQDSNPAKGLDPGKVTDA
jgi:hypothetical protein